MQKSFQSKCILWVQAARPKTLPAAVAPVAVGSAVAFGAGKFMLFPALICLACAVTLQIAVNFANDYLDYYYTWFVPDFSLTDKPGNDI